MSVVESGNGAALRADLNNINLTVCLRHLFVKDTGNGPHTGTSSPVAGSGRRWLTASPGNPDMTKVMTFRD